MQACRIEKLCQAWKRQRRNFRCHKKNNCPFRPQVEKTVLLKETIFLRAFPCYPRSRNKHCIMFTNFWMMQLDKFLSSIFFINVTIKNATSPWGQSWERVLQKHLYALVQNPFPRLSPWRNQTFIPCGTSNPESRVGIIFSGYRIHFLVLSL